MLHPPSSATRPPCRGGVLALVNGRRGSRRPIGFRDHPGLHLSRRCLCVCCAASGSRLWAGVAVAASTRQVHILAHAYAHTRARMRFVHVDVRVGFMSLPEAPPRAHHGGGRLAQSGLSRFALRFVRSRMHGLACACVRARVRALCLNPKLCPCPCLC